MNVYYNDFEPFACKWLENLTAAGLLPKGVIDGRSIKEVKADDVQGFVECHFFAGIGGWPYALRLAGWPDGVPVWTASCPCQPLSSAGKRGGEKDERHLWPTFFGLVRECRPATIFGEQVASKDGLEWLAGIRLDLESEGYAFGAADLCAASAGAPHIRQRLFWVAFSNVPELSGESSSGEQPKHESNDEARGLGKPESQGPQRERSFGCETLANERGGFAGLPGNAWRESIALPCVDNKSRRIESGAFPVAHGLPRKLGPELAGMDRVGLRAAKSNRVGRLKAYGNTIVQQVASEFVRAFLECKSDHSKP